MSLNSEKSIKIPADKIGIILRNYEKKQSEFVLPELWNYALDIIALLEHDFSEEMINRPHDKEFLKKHLTFVEVLGELWGDIHLEDYFDQGVLTSELVALHYLLVSGETETVYAHFLLKKFGLDESGYLKMRQTDLGTEDISWETIQQWKMEARVDAITDYLGRLGAKNEERKKSDIRIVTVGMEWEYHDPAGAYANWIYQARTGDPTEDFHRTFLENHSIVYTETVPGLMSELRVFDDTHDVQEHGHGLREVVTRPSRHYRTQLRELLSTQRAGGLLGSIAVHETFVGLELSMTNTQVMDVRAWLTAAGYIGSGTVDEDDISWAKTMLEETDESKDYMYDSDPKPSIVSEGEMVFFPNFRTRNAEKIIDTGQKNANQGVEWRGFPILITSGKTDNTEVDRKRYRDFTNYIRRVKHEWLACNVIAFVQMNDNVGTVGLKYRKLWEETMQKWELILRQYNEVNCVDEDRYERFKSGMNEVEVIKNNPYNIFLNRIDALSILDSSFRKKARKLIRDFNKACRLIERSESDLS